MSIQRVSRDSNAFIWRLSSPAWRTRLKSAPNWIAFACAVIVLLGLVIFNLKYHPLVITGTAEVDAYFLRADALLRGEGYDDPYRPPFYAVLAAGLSLLFDGNTFLAAKLISAFATSILVGISYVVARYFMEPKYALLVQLLVAVDMVVVQNGLLAATDALYATLVLALLWATIGRTNAAFPMSLRRAVGIGALFGLAYLTRYTAVFLLPFIVFALFKGRDYKRSILRFLVMMTAAVVVTSPWLIYNTVEHGSPLANDNWRNFAFALYGEGDYSYLENTNFSGYLDVFRHEPARVVQLWQRNIVQTAKGIFLIHVGSPLLALFLLFGLVLLVRRSSNRWLLLLYIVGCIAPFILTFTYMARFMLPAIPVLIVLGIMGLRGFFELISKAQARPINQSLYVGVVAVILSFVIFMPVRQLPPLLEMTRNYQPEEEMVMLDQVLDNATIPGKRPIEIVSTYQYLDYFSKHRARLQHEWTPHYAKNFPQSIAEATTAQRADYILVSDGTSNGAIRRGQIDQVVPECWTLVQQTMSGDDAIRLYHNRCSSTS